MIDSFFRMNFKIVDHDGVNSDFCSFDKCNMNLEKSGYGDLQLEVELQTSCRLESAELCLKESCGPTNLILNPLLVS